ncbi:hypothetical protein EJ110_NYTH08471 [Nymphaea thermarum]|nr:hypothetical protein EJ110_NYTH08471 [Nymphaea thermarum]
MNEAAIMGSRPLACPPPYGSSANYILGSRPLACPPPNGSSANYILGSRPLACPPPNGSSANYMITLATSNLAGNYPPGGRHPSANAALIPLPVGFSLDLSIYLSIHICLSFCPQSLKWICSLVFVLVAGLLTCCCPCVAFGRIAEIVDRGETSCIIGTGLYEVIKCLTGCACLYSAFFRAKLRSQYRLPESPAPDWAVHLLCEPCALAQEYRELKRRGFDMTIGLLSHLFYLDCYFKKKHI